MDLSWKHVPSWQRKLSVVLEVIILASGIFQLVFGDFATGVVTLVILGIILSPAIITRGRVRHVPIEFEVIFFVMVFMQLILGSIHEFYTKIPYYDKLVHFMFPFFVGFVAFLIAYVMYATKRLIISSVALVLLITLIALGVGAFWEILEYTSDRVIYPRVEGWHHFQGNAQQSANDDTMTDLVDDMLGGLFGALLGLYYINSSHRKKSLRLPDFVDEVAQEIYPSKKK